MLGALLTLESTFAATGIDASFYGLDDDPRDAEASLRRWLSSLKVPIPDINASAGGFDLSVGGGLCDGLNLERLKTSEVHGGTGMMIEASGLAISCRLHWSAKSQLIPFLGGKGEVLANVTNSSIGGSLSTLTDQGSPPLPSSLIATDCVGDIQITDLQFSGDLVSKILGAVSGLIMSILQSQLPNIICTNVDTLINTTGSEALQNGSAALRKFLAEPSSSPLPPSHLPEPHSDFADFSKNPGTRFFANLLQKVLGNMSSPHSINAMVAQTLGPDGVFPVDALVDFPITSVFRVPNTGAINLTLNSLVVRGLANWSGLNFMAAAPQQLSFGFGLRDLTAKANVTMAVAPDAGRPSPLHGGTLLENFDVDVRLDALGAELGLFMALNTTHVGGLTTDQLPHLGCLAPGLASLVETKADLQLAEVRPSVTPNEAGLLEGDVDQLLNTLLRQVLHNFGAAVESVGNHLLSVTLRDELNKNIQGVLASPPACPDPEPTYASAPLEHGMFVAAVSVGAVAVLAFLVIPCLVPKRGGHSTESLSLTEAVKQRRDPHAVPLASAPEPAAAPDPAPPSLPASAASLESWVEDTDDLPLARHPKLSLAFRLCLPAMVVVTALLFASSNSGEGANVRLSVTVGGEDVVELPPVFAFSLLSSIKDMWRGGVYPLAILIAAFSGLWPYGKLALMLVCWLLPARVLSVARRQALLEFLDAYGKWSLVDTFVLVIFMVAFRFDLTGLGAVSPLVAGLFKEYGTDARFTIYIEATAGFYSFLGATLMSLLLGHAMTAGHRYALQIGEYGLAEVYTGRDVFNGGRRRLCNVLRPAGTLEGKLFVYGPAFAVAASLVLVLIGIFIDTFQFRFLGLAGYVLGPEASVRPYSVVTLDGAIPESSKYPNSFGTRSIEVAFLFFACVVIPVYLIILIVLWTAPLSNKKQRHFLVAAQVLNAWSGLDVFCMSIMASVLEIRQFALFIVGDRCDGINAIVAKLPLADQLQGPKTCFDVESQLRPGFYILATAAVISVVTGHITLARCSKALFASDGRRTTDVVNFASSRRASAARGLPPPAGP